ncbi:MAG: helix-hairpin-helix domain-containing protein [Candidatus Methanomethylophilaceae archaeon]|jgi:hypothetical protein
MDEKEKLVAELATLPSVSEKCALGMYLLGIRSVEDLKGKDPVLMYSQLKERKDFFAEPCMLNMLKIAVGMANKGMTNLMKG